MLELVVDGIIYHQQARGGVSRIYSEILPRMCEIDDGLRITLLTTRGRAIKQSLPQHCQIVHREMPNVERHLRPWRLWERYAPSVRRMVESMVLGNGDGQIWHSTYYTLPSQWRGKQVITIVDMIYERYPEFFSGAFDEQLREQKRRAVTQADAVICISETTRRDVRDFYGVDSAKTFAVPLAHSEVFRVLTDGDQTGAWPRPFILYVGRRPHYKNFDLVIEAFAAWRRRDVDLVVVSDADWSKTELQSFSELKVEDRVHLLVDVDDNRLRRLYAHAIAFVYPSMYEGFGIPLLEAMACGCPVLASDIPSTREVAGDIPIYFQPDRLDELVGALDASLNESERTDREDAGIARASQFSWDETARRTLEVYYRL